MPPPATFPSVLRELLRTHQAFLSYAAKHAYGLDLTLPQLDVIITLGNTQGLSHKTLGEKTLITKGTLTGVVGRLEEKKLVERVPSPSDGRSQIVRLTEAGTSLYESAFPEHLSYLERIFKDYAEEDVTMLQSALLKLRKAVSAASCQKKEELSDESSRWCATIKDVCKHHHESPDLDL